MFTEAGSVLLHEINFQDVIPWRGRRGYFQNQPQGVTWLDII